MNKQKKIHKSTREVIIFLRNLLLYLSIGASFIFPRLQSLTFALALFLTFFSGEIKISKNLKLTTKFIASKSFILLYLIYVVGILWSPNSQIALANLTTKLPFLLMPIFVPFISNNLNKRNIVLALFIGVLSMVVINYFFYTDLLIKEGNNTFSLPNGFLHPTYIAINISLVLIVYNFNYADIRILKGIIESLFVNLFCISIIITSNSKAGFVALIIVMLQIGVVYFQKIQSKKIRWLLVISFLSMVFMSYKYTSLQQRFSDTYEEVFHPNEDPNFVMSTGQRLIAWRTSIELIKSHPLIGVGTGGEKAALTALYKTHNNETNLEHRLDAHQQYLQTFLSVGILGFLMLLFLFLSNLWYAIKHKKHELIGILFVFMFFGLTESMFERQAGIFLFSFLIQYFLYTDNAKEIFLPLFFRNKEIVTTNEVKF